MDEVSLATQITRLTDAVTGVSEDVSEMKATVADIDKRMRNLERAAFIAAGILVAITGGTTALGELLGGG